ncbi:GNAT family N-acetyltransferase [Eilatimonas milleporae]
MTGMAQPASPTGPDEGTRRPVPDWRTRPFPPTAPMQGRTCRLERLDPRRHAADLWAAYSADTAGDLWTYMTYGPFAGEADFRNHLDRCASTADPLFFAILDRASGQAHGLASYLRIDPGQGAVEVGHLCYAPCLQRTVAATEAMVLMMTRAFDELGYRRYQWCCNVANEGSKAAALRLGFRFEGVSRHAAVVKGRNRDTAWFSILDHEWPAQKARFADWLHPDNFDTHGRQKQPLARPS